jgi:hypothetical protein
MASVKLLVKKHNVSKRDGKTPIYVQYNYNRDKRILINTHRRTELKYWDFENDVLRRNHPKYDSINRHIKKIKLEIETIVSNALDVVSTRSRVKKARRIFLNILMIISRLKVPGLTDILSTIIMYLKNISKVLSDRADQRLNSNPSTTVSIRSL